MDYESIPPAGDRLMHGRSSAWYAALLGVLALVEGCVPSLPQGAVREANEVMPESYGGERSEANAVGVDWSDFFRDEHLVGLIDEALENNQELNIAVQESFIASYETTARRGEIFPRVGVGVGAGVDRVGLTTSQGASDEMAGLDQNLADFNFGLYSSWEIDVWGRLRDLADASARRYLATIAGRRLIITQIVAEIASLYYELMALDEQLAVVSNSAQLQEDALRVVRLQWQAAQTTSLAVQRFEAELLEFRSRRFEIQQRIVEAENRINFLVGRYPQPIERSSDRFMDTEPQAVAVGLPTDLLLNRPDVRQAELEMEAAQLDVSAARARFFPALSLEGGVGYQSFDVVRLLDTPASLIANIVGNLTAPLFNRTAIEAGYYGADARQRQAVIAYERAILTAYLEVINRISLVHNLAASYEVREQRVERLRQSIEISMRLFNSAHANYLEVLTARRDSLDAQLQLIETKQRQMAAAVSLYQALGGGWRDEPPRRAPDTPGEDGADE